MIIHTSRFTNGRNTNVKILKKKTCWELSYLNVHSGLKTKNKFLGKKVWYCLCNAEVDQLNICLSEAFVFAMLGRCPVWLWNNPLRVATWPPVKRLDWIRGCSELLGYRIPAHWIDGDWHCFCKGLISVKDCNLSQTTDVMSNMRDIFKIRHLLHPWVCKGICKGVTTVNDVQVHICI